MNKMELVVTMGGLGDRFRKAGYQIPKYMIEVKGKSLFEWSMESLRGYQEQAEQYIFIVKKDNETDAQAFIREKCDKLQLKKHHILTIDYLTDGQAATAMLAQPYWNKDHALLIYNIDTYVEPGLMNSLQLRGDGFLPCFHAPGDHWSFVRAGADGQAFEIKEKERISQNCTIGAYYFKSCGLYADLYKQYYDNKANLVNGEKYVAPLYNELLKNGGQVYICNIDANCVHVLGTPEELQTFAEQSSTSE